MVKKKLGDILVSAGRITTDQLETALKEQGKRGKKLGEVISELGYMSENEIIDVLSVQLSINKIDLDKVFINPDVANSIPKEVARKYNLIPVEERDGRLVIAMSDPLNVYAIDDIHFITKKPVQPCITDHTSIEKAIEVYFNRQTSDKALEDLKKEYNIVMDDKYDQAVIDDIQNAPAVRLTNSIINQSITVGASDIHIEPFEKEVIVRFRVDGVLSENMKIPQTLYSAVSTRIKIMAGMNIAEKRIPQDGRIEMDLNGKSFDFRVSSLPTVYGEKIVIRILDRANFLFDRTMLGFGENENILLDKLVRTPYGIVIVTGPTGSGKTTTLYSILKELNTNDKNLITVEDPVEYMLQGVNQVQVNMKAGLTFASGLRSILRQDPDVIMIGEIRDEETAQIAVRAAITGHFVLSTLHTNDAPSTITRIIDMGIEPYLVADSISGIIAQRLVRKLCPYCKEEYMPSKKEIEVLKEEPEKPLFRQKGCPSCNNSGYKGRLAVHEILVMNREIKELIETTKNTEQIREIAEKNGMTTLFDSCKKLVLKGETTFSEMVKTVYARE
ncbi:MAG: spore germination protein GerPC [Bacillota bacterium]|nr:spore germination protein GerPC [Bacillota bacterium]